MSLSQPQSYHMSPSMEQGSHFSTDPSRLHGSFPNSSTHSTGSTNVWPGDGWMLQAASGHRSRLAPDHNVAQPVTYDHQSYLNYPALDSERLVWVHQDSVAPQQEQEYPNPTAIGNQSQFVRVISPGDRFRHRPQPNPLEGGSHTFVGSSSNASSDMRYRMQPASAPPTMSLSDQPQRQVLTDNSNRQDPSGYASGFHESLHSRRTDKDNSMSRRQRAHLDSERKRREAINTGIHAIRQVLPDATEHDTKAAVLDKALQYIGHLKSQAQAKDSTSGTDVKTETNLM